MSLVELIPGVRSLSRTDKLRLIRFLAEELGEEEDSSSGRDPGMSRDGPDEDDRVQEVVHAVGLRNALRRMEEEP